MPDFSMLPQDHGPLMVIAVLPWLKADSDTE
ncbi:Uncharacterised protein [Vibrio cholerae]|nr:Uncharacterised protein [Vibrio cholerae]